MAIVRVSKNNYGVCEYQCVTTDLEANYPTKSDCEAGSIMEVINITTKKVEKYLVFNGQIWAQV